MRALLITVRILDRDVFAKIWELHVGRINLYLLDTDMPENSPEDRLITRGALRRRSGNADAPGNGARHRRRARARRPRHRRESLSHERGPLGLPRPRTHPATVAEKGLDFYAALQVVAASNIFTTHTPVPAGNDAFPREMMKKYFGDFAKEMGIPFDELFTFGQTRVNADDPFSMTILALRTSRHANGVSKLHGDVSRGLWKDVWAGVPEEEVPITSITNGIHTKTWMAPEFSALYTKYLGKWEDHLTDADFWRGVIDIPDAELWETHQKLKRRLVEFVRERMRMRARTHRRIAGSDPQGQSACSIRKCLTIGFARRFATYKRGALLFSDKERLARLLNDATRPVQFIFAGKSHPRDEGGKALIQEVYKFSREAGLRESHRLSSRTTTPTSRAGSSRASIFG